MAQRILKISFEVMADMLRTDAAFPPQVVKDGLPADARILHVRRGWPDGIELLIESEEWSYLMDENGEIAELFMVLRNRDDEDMALARTVSTRRGVFGR
jgi:hypothetical protein